MKLIPHSISRRVGRTILKTKKNSPHIFFGGGVVAVISGTVLACKATLKLEETVDDIKVDIDVLKTMKPNVGVIDKFGHTYSEHDYFKEAGFVYTKSAIKLGKLYGPSIVIGGVGIAALTGSHIQLTRRNTALTVTLAAVSKAFEDYRVRVASEIGEKRELELHRAVTEEKNEQNKKVQVTDPSGWSPYARWFDEKSRNWVQDSEMNRIFIQCQQNYANQLLTARGHVFLNEIYDSLGMERSPAGAVVGWIFDGDGDNYVDFGLYQATSLEFINDVDNRVMLDFNVDGVIYEQI